MRLHFGRVASAVSTIVMAVSVHAAPIMPDFANVPTGWSTDRYAPASFSNVGSYQGRNDVLGIAIDSTGDAANRGAQNNIFYNTQGKKHALAGGPGSVLAADLFVDAAWRDAASGLVRSDMWGVMSDASGVTDYAIIGFTNYGGSARLRVWDADTANGWVDLASPVAFGGWNAFEIELTATSFVYRVGGVQVYEDSTIGADHFSAVIMQAYNFADPTLGNPTPTTVPYVAHWSNDVPEPGSLALAGLSLGVLALARRRRAG